MSYQEDVQLDESIVEPLISELDEPSEFDDRSEFEDAPELDGSSEFDDSSETDSDNSPEFVPVATSDVRAPIRNNPFTEARQYDPQGLLIERLGDPPRIVIDNYSDITGHEHSYQVAGYNAHRLYHNPLYFEEPNLERYGNERDYQRLASGLKFFSNAALLPIRLVNLPACSRVTTLGFRRPGEFVPFRHFEHCPPKRR